MKQPIKNNPLSVQKLGFDTPGKMAINFDDGRILIVPLKYFPEIKKLPIDKRKKYTIVDDRTILFMHANSVYHIEDFVGTENKWRSR